MQSAEHIVVFETGTDVEALLYRDMLEDAGIEVQVRERVDPWQSGLRTAVSQASYQLIVSEEDLEQARELIADLRREVEAGPYQMDEDDEELLF